MSNSNICKIINCLTAKINKLEKQVCNNNNNPDNNNKPKSFNCTNEIKILHSDISSFQESSDNNNNYIIIENKLYQYSGNKCDTEYENLKVSLETLKADIENNIGNIPISLADYIAKLEEFNICLTENKISSEFIPTTNLTESSISGDVQSVIDQLNEFYSTEFSDVCIPPEEYTKCFFIRYNENFQEFIYLENNNENNNGTTIEEKVLSGECNVLFECSTGTIYMFENEIWSPKCTLQTSIAQPS